MEPLIIDGKKLASFYEEIVKNNTQNLINKGEQVPGLAVILVGDNPASEVYVKNKERRARKCLFQTFQFNLSENVKSSELKDLILKLNADSRVNGILLQLPLPQKLLDQNVKVNDFLNLIDPSKDADCLNEINQGKLFKAAGLIYPCTPFGVLKLLDYTYFQLENKEKENKLLEYIHSIDFQTKDIQFKESDLPEKDLSGKHTVVVGRSELVGKSVALMLLQRNSTVTIAHSKTKNLKEICSEADILIAACGVPEIIKKDFVKEGAIVIDVGTSKANAGTNNVATNNSTLLDKTDSKKSIVGDVDFNDVKSKVRAISPVPGGVGPMTIAMLFHNTYKLRMQRS